MNTIERELLQKIITDRPFAEYITQRIDIGDFDDEMANTIYNGIVDLLYQDVQLSFEALVNYFSGNEFITESVRSLAIKERAPLLPS
jgi:hypothetical protein